MNIAGHPSPAEPDAHRARIATQERMKLDTHSDLVQLLRDISIEYHSLLKSEHRTRISYLLMKAGAA